MWFQLIPLTNLSQIINKERLNNLLFLKKYKPCRMKNIKYFVLSSIVLGIILVASGYTKSNSESQNAEVFPGIKYKQIQTINLFVTHGHCSTPFAGIVNDLEISYPERGDLGNPLENMQISFEVDPNTFNVCAKKELTARIKTPGLFIGQKSEGITFQSTQVYTMGLDWYQVNGIMSIKGVDRKVKLFASGIRDSKEALASSLVIQGQMDLFDWGIDYDKIVSGKSDSVPNKWMYINLRVDLS